MAGLVLTAMVILGMAGSATLAPLSSNPRGGLVAGLVLVGTVVTAWRRLGGPGRRAVFDLRPPPRADGLPTSVHLQIHLAAATVVTALLVALDLVAATRPSWRLTTVTCVHDLVPPAYAVLAATLALVIGAEAARRRAKPAPTLRPQPIGQAFALAVWRWVFMGWTGLLLGLTLWANGRRDALDPAALIVVVLVLLIGVPALGVVTARLLEGWTGVAVLRIALRSPPSRLTLRRSAEDRA